MFQKRGAAVTGFFAHHKMWMAVSTLVGTIIGAGILGMPYAIAKVGFFYGLILTVLIGISFLFLNLFLGEIVLRTKTQHQLTGYAEKYLGSAGKKAMTFVMLVSIYGALTAYLIGEGQALHTIVQMGSPLLWTLLFFIVGVFIVCKGVKATGKAEAVLVALLILMVILIGIFSFRNLGDQDFLHRDLSQILLTYGVIIFAFTGSAAIPEMQEVLGKEKKKMKKAIIIGSLVPILIYLLFTVVIMSLVGIEQFELLQPNERIATVALSIYSSPILGIFANLLAVLTMFTSFLTLSLALIEVYHYDYALPPKFSLVLTFIFPLLIVIFGLTTFMGVLGVTGVLAGGLDGILITIMHWKARTLGERKPEYQVRGHLFIKIGLVVMFVAGIVYQLKITLGI